MIDVGPDGLSRGIWMSPKRHTTTSVLASKKVLEAVPYSPALGQWAVSQVDVSLRTPLYHIKGLQDWTFANICGWVSIWTPAPEVARQALRFFLDAWVESPWNSAGLFLIPRVLQREWAFLSKHIHEVLVIYPHALPPHLQYASLIPLLLLYLPCYVRLLPLPDRMDKLTDRTIYQQWHREQADFVRGLS
jgi:hypothetical protein